MPSRIVAALEIGSQSIKVLVGEVFDGGSLNIIGRSELESKGVLKGMVRDYREVSDRVGEALDMAESSAGTNVEAAYLAISGSHLEGTSHPARIRVQSPDNRVSADDVRRVNAEAKGKQLPDGRLYVHFIRNGYALDGRSMDDPIGFEGSELSVTYWLLHGDSRIVTDQIHVVNSQNVKVEDVIVSSVASGCMVASEEERKAGCLILDIGKGTTDYAFYRDGFIVRTGSIPVGGEHLTNDLSVGLRVGRSRAEHLKKEKGSALVSPDDKAKMIHLYGDLMIGDKTFYASSMNQILEVRLEELFEIVRDECGAGNLKNGAVRVLLTGGTSRLDKIANLAERVFSIPARTPGNPDWVADELRDPEYSTCLGVLHFALQGEDSRQTK